MLQSAWEHASWFYHQLVVELAKALCFFFAEKAWIENPLDVHSAFPQQYSRRKDANLGEHLALGKPSSSSGAPAATNVYAHARSWQSTHRRALHIKPVKVGNIQRAILAKYFGEGTRGGFHQVVKVSCASDGTRLASKDVLKLRSLLAILRLRW